MFKEREKVVRNAMMFLDIVILIYSFVLAFFVRIYWYKYYSDYMPEALKIMDISNASFNYYLSVLFFGIVFWLLTLNVNGMYRSLRTAKLPAIAWIIIKSSVLSLFFISAFIFFFKLEFISRFFIILFIGISSMNFFIARYIVIKILRYARKLGHNYRKILIVGTGPRANQFIKKIKRRPEWGIEIVGIIDDEPEWKDKAVEASSILGVLDDIVNILGELSVDEVVFVVPRSRLSYIERAVYACETQGVKATIAIDLFELKIAKAQLTDIEDVPLLTFETTVAKEWQLFIKRFIDITVSGAAMLAFAPVFIFAALLIRVTSPGPVLFKQRRIGLNGRRFILYKFRTMYRDAPRKRSSLEEDNEMDGPVFKMKNDPRVTPVGRYLRKFSIDELPQLYNIFMGHMSIVGPRPLPAYETAKFEPWQRRRQSMRPGLTCIWQISGRSNISFEKWMEMDLEYLDTWSLLLDIKIILKTIPVVLFGVGAY